MRNPLVSERLEHIVMTSMAKNPADRFPGCGSFARALSSLNAPELQVVTQAGAKAVTEVLTPPRPVGSAKRVSVWLNVMMAVLALTPTVIWPGRNTIVYALVFGVHSHCQQVPQ